MRLMIAKGTAMRKLLLSTVLSLGTLTLGAQAQTTPAADPVTLPAPPEAGAPVVTGDAANTDAAPVEAAPADAASADTAPADAAAETTAEAEPTQPASVETAPETAEPQAEAQDGTQASVGDQGAVATPATEPEPAEGGTAPENAGSTGWTGGTGGAFIGTTPAGAVPQSKTWQPPVTTGLDLLGGPNG